MPEAVKGAVSKAAWRQKGSKRDLQSLANQGRGIRLVSSLPERGSCLGFEDLSSVTPLCFNIYTEKFLPGIYIFFSFFFAPNQPAHPSPGSTALGSPSGSIPEPSIKGRGGGPGCQDHVPTPGHHLYKQRDCFHSARTRQAEHRDL